MSLSTQLTRGAVALPMLLMFVLLGLSGREPTQAADPVALARAELLDGLCDTAAKPRVLVLAEAPADLGKLVIRWKAPCRA